MSFGLAGRMRLAASAKILSASYVDSQYQLISGTSRSYTGISFGAVPGNGETRHILVGSAHLENNSRLVTGGTIGGQSASLLYGPADIGAYIFGFIIAEVPTGTSGTVTVTYSGSESAHSRIFVWRLINWTGSATKAATQAVATGASDPSVSPTITAGDICFAVGATWNSGGSALAWTGATSDAEAQLNASVNRASGARRTTVGSGSFSVDSGSASETLIGAIVLGN